MNAITAGVVKIGLVEIMFLYIFVVGVESKDVIPIKILKNTLLNTATIKGSLFK